MLRDRKTMIEQVRRLAIPLSSTDRLALIRAIASLETPERKQVSRPEANGHTLDAEQEAWFARPSAERKRRYAGEYVAVRAGEVVDHDPTQRALYLRVLVRYGSQPVLIVRADWDAASEFAIHSPRLER